MNGVLCRLNLEIWDSEQFLYKVYEIAGRGIYPWPVFFVCRFYADIVLICLCLSKLYFKVSEPTKLFKFSL